MEIVQKRTPNTIMENLLDEGEQKKTDKTVEKRVLPRRSARSKAQEKLKNIDKPIDLKEAVVAPPRCKRIRTIELSKGKAAPDNERALSGVGNDEIIEVFEELKTIFDEMWDKYINNPLPKIAKSGNLGSSLWATNALPYATHKFLLNTFYDAYEKPLNIIGVSHEAFFMQVLVPEYVIQFLMKKNKMTRQEVLAKHKSPFYK